MGWIRKRSQRMGGEMKKVKHQTLLKQIAEGRVELLNDIFGSSTKYAELRYVASGKRETIEVHNYKTQEAK